jgi:hypothetical protein
MEQKRNATGQNAHSGKSGYLKTAQFSPKPASIVDVLRILRNVRNLQRSKKESHSDTDHILFYFILFYFITILFISYLLFLLHYTWDIFAQVTLFIKVASNVFLSLLRCP